MPPSVSELLAKEMLRNPATTDTEVHHRYVVLMGKFSDDYGLNAPSKIEEAIRARRIDDALVEEWIAVRQAMEALGLRPE